MDPDTELQKRYPSGERLILYCPMTNTIRVFVNASVLELPDGTDVGEAVAAHDPEMRTDLAKGAAYVTDARGIEIEPSTRLANGAILRVVRRARRGADADS